MLPFARFLSPCSSGVRPSQPRRVVRGFARLSLVGLLGLAFLLARPVRLIAQVAAPLPRSEAPFDQPAEGSPNSGYGIASEPTGEPQGSVPPASRPTFASEANSAVADPPNEAAGPNLRLAPLGPADFETGTRPDTGPVSSRQAPPVTRVKLPAFIRSDKRNSGRPVPESSRSSQFNGWTSLLTTASSLAVVLGLFFVTAWIMRRASPRGSRGLPAEALEILGRAPLGGRQQMVLLRCGRRLLLVSVAPDSSETLTEITDPAEVDYLAGLCTQGLSNSSTAAFRQVFERFTDRHEETHLEETGPVSPVGHGAEVS